MAPESLEERTLRQFDALVSRGELLWEPNIPILFKSEPFNFQFRHTPSLAPKPYANNLTKDSKPVFSDTDPDFVLGQFGSPISTSRGSKSHTLILNKYCVVRPQYVLHTTEFEKQREYLNEGDFKAVWEVFLQLEGKEKGRHVIIYNCGAEGGSSLGHKHMQILPIEREDGGAWEMWPDVLPIDKETKTVPVIPFVHAIEALPSSITYSELSSMYQQLLTQAKVPESPGHNLIMTGDWMLVTPRSARGLGIMGVNASCMVGMVWAHNEEVIKEWMAMEGGPVEVLKAVGVSGGKQSKNGC